MMSSYDPSILSYVIILFPVSYTDFQLVCYKPGATYMPDSLI